MRLLKRLFIFGTIVQSFAALWLCPNVSAAEHLPIPSAENILSHLDKNHPRLLASSNDFVRLSQNIVTNPVLKAWSEKLQKEADKMLTEAPSKYELTDGVRLLAISRRTVDRIYALAMVYKLTSDQRYLDRAWLELKTVCEFQDWHPKHFLDTAEMTHAVAIGYDWLYHSWTPEQRAFLRHAIVTMGIKPALEVYLKKNGWAATAFNWNQVCNGGIGTGALAIAEDEPALAGEFLHDSLNSIQIAMGTYAPDGAWPEGPGYWDYATRYNVIFVASLQTALHTDFGLGDLPGFSDAGYFPIYMTGPIGRTFNFADAHDRIGNPPEMFWLAQRFHRPEFTAFGQHMAGGSPLELLWFEASDPTTLPKLPPNKFFHKAQVVSLRSQWNDPNATFIGFKAGSPKINHSHLDLGSFVLDAQGQRWANDLAGDNYNLPGYFGKGRWEYYRLRAEGHNTLVLNPKSGPDQNLSTDTKIIRFQSTTTNSFAIADLTPAYENDAQKVQRGIALINRDEVIIQDEVQCDQPADLWWFLHTQAKISLTGSTATLTIGDKQMTARILSPKGATFTKMKDEPLSTSPHPEGQANDSAFDKLTIHLPKTKNLRLTVILTPGTENQSRPKVKPLQNW